MIVEELWSSIKKQERHCYLGINRAVVASVILRQVTALWFTDNTADVEFRQNIQAPRATLNSSRKFLFISAAFKLGPSDMDRRMEEVPK